ncbi:LamG domain-containing protein [Flavisolibacter sp. BT320]|nr:LamG domain-containing protein [Flavisolibacter longurius]
MVSILFSKRFLALLGGMVLLASCKKDGNPNDLPDVSPGDYEGTIDGFRSSDEIFPEDLVAYWSFDDTKNELKSNTAPTSSANDQLVADGVKGQSLQLNSGYLYYGTQFPQFRTADFKSWTISLWVKLKNNGSKRTMVFQLARPGMLSGNINLALNTQSYPATNDSILRIQPTFAAVNANNNTSNFQDNLNNVLDRINLNDWVHIVMTYDITTGVFNNWANGVKVGNFPNRGTTNLFRSWEPSEVIIGTNYNSIPGKEVNTDAAFARMTGQIDELRIFDRPLPDAFIRALYSLGRAKQ